MASRFPDEFKSITSLRAANPQMPAKTLARKISNAEEDFLGASGRSFLSIYSVIRRYDAKAKAAAVAAATVKAVKKAGKRIAESVV